MSKTTFVGIQGVHDGLYSRLRKGDKPSAQDVHFLLKLALHLAPSLHYIEDRSELGDILRFWACYLASIGEDYPDIDIDSPDRQPNTFCVRPLSSATSGPSPDEALQRLRSLAVRLDSPHHVSEEHFRALCDELFNVLPGAVTATTLNQRRNRLDVLRDIIWATEHNVLQFRELMEEQAFAGKHGLHTLWVHARSILDTDERFYRETVRANLLDSVQHCYFLSNIAQFEQLYGQAKKDKKLGREHLDLLSCIEICGDAVDSVFLLDYALRNPMTMHPEGRLLLRENGSTMFFRLWPDALQVACETLSNIRTTVKKCGSAWTELGRVSARLVAPGAEA